jgi:hypothetical protein
MNFRQQQYQNAVSPCTVFNNQMQFFASCTLEIRYATPDWFNISFLCARRVNYGVICLYNTPE